MKNKTLLIKVLCALLALLLLSGCGDTPAAVVTPAPEVSAEPTPAAPEIPDGENVVRVTNVDELLAAIAPDTTIELAAGDYVLYTASNYGRQNVSEYYEWTKEYDGPALTIHHVDNLVIRGEGADKVTLSAEPRYANVLSFVSCRNLTLEGITAGHLKDGGLCGGGVLRFEYCHGCTVRTCGLFGCGTIGVWAVDCAGLSIADCAIYECSYGAVSLSSCRNVRVTGGEVYGCGRREGIGGAIELFEAGSCENVGIAGVRVHDNTAERLLSSYYSRSVLFLSGEVTNNAFSSFFKLEGYGAVVDGCLFERNSSASWYQDYSEPAADLTGRQLDSAAFKAMTLRSIDLDVVAPLAEPEPVEEVEAGTEITVTTVDEFLAAIGPARTIILDGAFFDLSTASDYGGADGVYYRWEDCYDGPGLVIEGVRGLTIKAASDDPAATVLSAVPRYADVLRFKGCRDIAVVGLTVGHTTEPGECAGGVLLYENCRNVTVDSCRLYGCGVLGLYAFDGADFTVRNSEIYECSQGAVLLNGVNGVEFVGCDVHDVPSPALSFFACPGVRWDGEALPGSYYDMQNGAPAEIWPDAVG